MRARVVQIWVDEMKSSMYSTQSVDRLFNEHILFVITRFFLAQV